MSKHADDDTLRIANEEAANAPGLVDRTVDHLVPGLHRFGVCDIDGFTRTDVHAHLGLDRLHTRRGKDDLRPVGSGADVAAAEGSLLDRVPPYKRRA